MKQRFFTAVIALIVLVSAVFALTLRVVEVLLGMLLLAGAWEWSSFLRPPGAVLRWGYVALIGVLLLAAAGLREFEAAILIAALVWWIGAFVWTFFYPTTIPAAVRWAGGIVVLVPLYVALVALLQSSPWLLMFTLLVVWAADSGAYFAGRLFGRARLAPAISPAKTWEGVIGGIVAVSLLATAVGLYRGLSLAEFVPFCLAAACLSIVGDLTVSMFKRDIGIKDSGTLFPGHGGVLDRIDSVAAAAPLFALGVSYEQGLWSGIQ
jgi:phosphatidate cytidylyltransferase